MIGCCLLVLLYFPNKEPQSGAKKCMKVVWTLSFPWTQLFSESEAQGKVWSASQPIYDFRLEENVSRAMGQNSLTPEGQNNLNFRLARDQVVHLERTGNLRVSRPDVNIPLGFASENIEGLGETKLTVSLGASY